MNGTFVCLRNAFGKIIIQANISYHNNYVSIYHSLQTDHKLDDKFSEFVFPEVLEDQENDFNCSITCDRTQYEPGLSYAELSEFNIDQVALTTSAKKEAVREKFEAAIETQQRVVESVRNSDEALMQTFLKLAEDLYEAMNSTLALASDTNLLSARYKFPNILDDDDDSPSQDIEATRKRAEDIGDTEDGMKISFWESRDQFRTNSEESTRL